MFDWYMADADAVTPSSNTRSYYYILQSVPSSPKQPSFLSLHVPRCAIGAWYIRFSCPQSVTQYYSIRVAPSIPLLLWLLSSNTSTQAGACLVFDTINIQLAYLMSDKFSESGCRIDWKGLKIFKSEDVQSDKILAKVCRFWCSWPNLQLTRNVKSRLQTYSCLHLHLNANYFAWMASMCSF